MALTGTGAALGAAMKSAVHGLPEADKSNPDKVYKAMGEAIIAHIISNGVAATTTLGTAGATPLPGNIV